MPSYSCSPIYNGLLGALLLFTAGCATTSHSSKTDDAEPSLDTLPAETLIVAADNSSISWDELEGRAAAADVIVLAEQHDDALAHRLQLELTEALVQHGPVAICMEMFERDDQPLVDAYLAGTISKKALLDSTNANKWADWDTFYQPIVEAAKSGKAPVIAANASRRFTGLARNEGFETLATIMDAYPTLFVVPSAIEQSAYAERFKDTMRQHTTAPVATKRKSKKPAAPSMPPMTEEKLEGMFRAQQVWDATMADSVLHAWRTHGKALLMVGQFHTDHDGGLLLRMKAAEPDLTYLTISVQKAQVTSLREEDRGRADYVVFPSEDSASKPAE